MEEKNDIYELDFSEEVLSVEEANEVSKLEREFLESYIANKDKVQIDEWLPCELKKHLPQKSEEEIQEMSSELIDSLNVTEEMKASQQKAIASGRSKDSWLASTIMQSTSNMSVQESAKYLQGLDDAVKKANEAMHDAITTKAGLPNQNMNLDGFIAEQHHVNSYNMKAQATGGNLHAEVLKPKPGETYGKNSVDIVLKDANGKIVSRYQAKYGATAEDTIRMIKNGDYRGQQLIVPAEQVEDVQKAFPGRKVSSTIGEGDVTSTPLGKGDAKEMQEKAQNGNFMDADWNDYAAKDIALGIGKQVGFACLQGAAVSAGMSIATKVWHGEPIDGEEVLVTAIESGADFGVKTAAAGALKAASEKGILKVIPKGTSASTFASIAFVAVEDVKVLKKVATGELTAREGIDVMEQTTGSCVAGMVASAKGASIGASIGTVLGPVGAAVGGFVGGTIGYIAGSTVGKLIVKGVQKIRDKAIEGIKKVAKGVVSGIKAIARGFASIFGF